MLCSDKVVIFSNIPGTIKNIKGHKELPIYPGIPSEKFLDKSFSTISFDIQTVRDGKISEEIWITDYVSAKEQILNGKHVQDFGFDELVDPNTV